VEPAQRFERILLATDGSDASQAAVETTIAIAKSLTAKVRVAQVWNLEVRHRHGHWDVEVRGEAGKLVDATVERLFRAGVLAEREICRADGEHVGAAIACAAKAFEADLVVIGSRGLSDWQSLSIHSTSQELLCGLDCPVLIVRARPIGAAVRTPRIVFAIASGDDLGKNVRAAVAIAPSETSVMVVHIARAVFSLQGFAHVESSDEIRETISRACRLLADGGVPVHGIVAHEGPVAPTVAKIATDWNADLILVGSSRMGDIGSLFLGPVSHDLLHGTDRPVLTAERVRA
jgi:nucleotide-binding universal stress UspA family protein